MASHLEPYKHLAGAKQVAFTYTFDDAVPKVIVGDPTRINQVLINLVSNAIKFTETGSIRMHGSVLAVDEAEEAVELLFTVTDTGIGIPAEKQAVIFESFTQSDQTTSRKYGGFGLGLAISKKLVRLMHGEMGVSSPPERQGEGSSFWFSVKLNFVKSEELAMDDDEYELSYKVRDNYQVLVVDDNPINVLLIQDVLENYGAVVTTAEGGEEAVQIALDNPFDLILMDIQMPGVDGLEASSRLRRAGLKSPIIAFSANAYKDDIAKSMEAGMNDHLCKPFTNRDLVAILKKWA
ncbi:hypothetical protein GCM10028895_47780 [Pontibacter rugosus]